MLNKYVGIVIHTTKYKSIVDGGREGGRERGREGGREGGRDWGEEGDHHSLHSLPIRLMNSLPHKFCEGGVHYIGLK